MMRATAGFFPLHVWNVLQATAITLLCLLVSSVLVFHPDRAAEILSTVSARSAKELSESRFEFVRDVAIVWTTGIIFILFDALSRNIRSTSLLRILFFKRPDDCARQERALITAAFWISFLLVPALIVVNLGRNFLGTDWLIVEDGPLEYATAGSFLIAATLLSYIAFRQLAQSSPRDYRNAAMLIALSGMMFLIGFEEISWGQRILGFETPASLEQINDQGEFTIHNIATDEVIRSYTFVAGILLWFLAYLPGPSLMIVFAIILILSTHITMEELVEQLASLVVLLYSVRLALHSLRP
jgi:hypothetical protein